MIKWSIKNLNNNNLDIVSINVKDSMNPDGDKKQDIRKSISCSAWSHKYVHMYST